MGKEGYIGTRFLDGPVGCAGIAGSGLEVPGLAAWQGAPRTSLSLTARLGSLRVPPRKCASPSSRACLPVRTCPHSGMADAGCAGATSRAHHGLGGSQSLPRGCASCPLRRTGSLTQEERVPLAEVLGCSGGHSHFHCHPGTRFCPGLSGHSCQLPLSWWFPSKQAQPTWHTALPCSGPVGTRVPNHLSQSPDETWLSPSSWDACAQVHPLSLRQAPAHLVPAFPCRYRMIGWLEDRASSYHIWSFPWAFFHQTAGTVCLEAAAEGSGR